MRLTSRRPYKNAPHRFFRTTYLPVGLAARQRCRRRSWTPRKNPHTHTSDQVRLTSRRPLLQNAPYRFYPSTHLSVGLAARQRCRRRSWTHAKTRTRKRPGAPDQQATLQNAPYRFYPSTYLPVGLAARQRCRPSLVDPRINPQTHATRCA